MDKYSWILIISLAYILTLFAVFDAGRDSEKHQQELVDSESYLLGYESASLQCMDKKEKGK